MKLDDRQITQVVRVLGLAVFAWVLLRTAWVCDDAFISFRVVENAVAGHGLRWNIADRVQVFTHPLWMLLHIPLRTISGELYYTSLGLCATASLATMGLLVWRAASAAHAGILVLALALSSRAFIDYSTSGLENPLTHLLAVAFFLATIHRDRTSRGMLLQASLAGLLAWNRLDTVVVTLPALAISVWREGFGRAWKPVAAGFTPCVLWLLFATIYYGHPLPNTAFAKLGAGSGLGELIPQGWHYSLSSLRDDPLTLGTVFVALVVATVRRRHLAIALGIVFYLLYVLRIGGDFMGGRFFTLPFVLALAILAVEASHVRARIVVTLAALAVVAGMLLGRAPLTSGPAYGRTHTKLIDPYGIADERAYYFRMSGLWNGTETTLAKDDKWFEAMTARECGFPLVIAGAIGFYGYAVGPAVHVLDFNALGDPVLARLPAIEDDPLYVDWYRQVTGDEPATRRRIGHFMRNIPPGYVSYLLGDATRFEDDRLVRFIEDVTQTVRAPLFSTARIRAALDVALDGRPDDVDGPAYRRALPIPLEEIVSSSANSAYRATLHGCAISKADPQAALESLRHALTGCESNGLAWRCLAHAFGELQRPGLALEARQRVAELAPDSDWAHAELASARLTAGDVQGAVESYRRASGMNPGNPGWWQGLAQALEAAGDRPGAERARARAERLTP